MKQSVIDKIVITVVSIIIPSIAVIILDYFLQSKGYDYSSFDGKEIAKTLVGVWATLLGFMITSVSILVTLGGNEYVLAFRKSQHYHTVMYTNTITSILMLAATVFCIVIMCLNIWNRVCFNIFIFLLISTFVSLILSVYFLFFLVFKSR
jgi:hypothetical protein